MVLFFTIVSFLSLLFNQISSPVQNRQDILKEGDKILFVGNGAVGSEGGLHHHFRRTLKRMQEPLTIETDWIAMYGANSLADMYTDELVERIRTGTDDWVIVQSGDTSDLYRFKKLIQEHGKQMVVYGTWPENPMLPDNSLYSSREDLLQKLIVWKAFESQTAIPVIPCGLAFYDLLVNPPPGHEVRPDYLFVPGSSVQNDLGTVVNIAAIFYTLTGRNPVGLPVWDPFDPELIQYLQEHVKQQLDRWDLGETNLPPISKKSIASAKETSHMPDSKIHWQPIIKEGDSVYYVGNSFIGTEGGLENHFPRLLKEITPGFNIATQSDIFWGQPLSRMFTPVVQDNIKSGHYDLVIVTSGDADYMKKFYELMPENKEMAIHMTWGWNPTLPNQDLTSFRDRTKQIVNTALEFEKETGVPIIPCGLIFYDLVVDPPPVDGLRLDWVFMEQNIHQNHIGTMANAAAHYAVLTGKSPVGLPMWDPYPLELVEAVQKRAWKIVQDWKQGIIYIKEPTN